MATEPMRPKIPAGIVGYGCYLPRYRLPAGQIARLWQPSLPGRYFPVQCKTVPGPDEDTITMAIEAARNALRRAAAIMPFSHEEIGAVWVGSESHPYAVKPSGTVVAEALGITPCTLAADLEFACKAGSEAMQAACALVGSGMAPLALAIGMDTAQARPGDALEYTAAAGGAAFLWGPAEQSVAVLEASLSWVSDTPDFFRRAHQAFPEHGHRFTGQPAYFQHIEQATRGLLSALNLAADDFQQVIFHQPNVKFPRTVARRLGFREEQLAAGLLCAQVGNTYAGAALLGLAAALEVARPGDRILMVSFGSGAGSDAMVFTATEAIQQVRHCAPGLQDYLQRAVEIDYATYARWRGKIVGQH